MNKALTCFLALLVIVLLIIPASCDRCFSLLYERSPDKVSHITILHTNDIHGHLDNMPNLCSAVDQLRLEAGEDNVLLFDAGDMFSGSIYYRLYQEQASLWFANYLEYEIMCPGNHDFDGYPETLTRFADGANFRIISSNIEVPGENPLYRLIPSGMTFEKDGENYGILGLLTKETAEISDTDLDIKVTDYVSAARRIIEEMQKGEVNKIIALTHIGWNEDIELARNVGDIDIIIGGHTHTVPGEYPTVVNEDGSPTLIVQAGGYAKYLGRLEVSFDREGVITDWTGSELIPIDETIPDDSVCAAKLAGYRAPVEATMSAVVGETLVDLDGERADIRSRETNLGNLVADSMLSKARQVGVNMAIISGGGIRDSIFAGDITLEQVMNVLPFDNYLVTFDLTGKQIIDALENGVSRVGDVEGRFPQVAGIRFVWDPSAEPGSRIVSVQVNKAGNFEAIDPSATFHIVTTSFLYEGGDGYTMFTQGENFINLGFTDYEVLAEYITAHSPINPQTEGRITSR